VRPPQQPEAEAVSDPLRDPSIDNKIDELRTERAKRKAKRDLDDLKWLLDDARGRRFYASMLDYCQVLHEPTPGNDSLTNFNNGKKSLGVKLFVKMLDNYPEAFMRMINEATSEARQEELEEQKVKEEGNDA
jgi:hypothetical protein